MNGQSVGQVMMMFEGELSFDSGQADKYYQRQFINNKLEVRKTILELIRLPLGAGLISGEK